jgi:hypothetical protein
LPVSLFYISEITSMTMVKRKVMTAARAGHRSKHTKAKTTTPETFIWNANDWMLERDIREQLVTGQGANTKQVLVEDFLKSIVTPKMVCSH